MDRGSNDDPSSKLATLHNFKSDDPEERLKKGEWSEGAIHELLNAYEAKWNNRSRGNFGSGIGKMCLPLFRVLQEDYKR